jgi:hypothetical protein
MDENWSLQEVEATISCYFNMLDKELRGIDHNKSEYRRQLSVLLNKRSNGAIERKHQNISAILIELGFPYIPGYKPLRNYQQLLFDIVFDRLRSKKTLLNLVRVQVEEQASIPDVNDILKVLVEPPMSSTKERDTYVPMIREPSSTMERVDYLAKEAQNHSLGIAGEKFVVQFEIARLINAGKENLASKVTHVSDKQSDTAGYDILSFEISGRERLIEVKTTAFGPLTPFFVTSNELKVSRNYEKNYFLYRAFEFRRRPKIFTKQGRLDTTFNLNPSQYIANII